jgi:glycosyltransferase involved in cell wall biosynthesis
MGKPVIVSDDCGADEYITNGVDGIVLSPGDMEGMRTAIVKVMSDPVYAKRLGENGKRAMQDPRYEPKYFLTKLLEAVRDSVAERRGARG